MHIIRLNDDLPVFAASAEPDRDGLGRLIPETISHHYRRLGVGPDLIAVPSTMTALMTRWRLLLRHLFSECVIITNGAFLTELDWQTCKELPGRLDADVVPVSLDPQLDCLRERARLTSAGNLAGFRRLYCQALMPQKEPDHWPEHIILTFKAFTELLKNNIQISDYNAFRAGWRKLGLKVRPVATAGRVADLRTEAGLLNILDYLGPLGNRTSSAADIDVHPRAKLTQDVLAGDNVKICEQAFIDGPAILAQRCRIGPEAVIKNSIIGPGVAVPKKAVIINRVILNAKDLDSSLPRPHYARQTLSTDEHDPQFRTWPMLHYARIPKRAFDILFALTVLILFMPILPILALAVKLSSPGPAFFRHKRQGLHGKDFDCLKFRTMITGADEIQDKLRFVNEVDGPQFKMDNDPRATKLGAFLRATFIDEIPQFINILKGQMSVIGPRPSPRRENSKCPFWRDARLSVRPGVTGLWQVCRTRIPGRDFQEWIKFDTEYVKGLSMRMDFYIFCKTVIKIIKSFITQF